MPDPNAPQVPPEELPPEEALQGSQPTSENAEASSPPSETPSEPTETPPEESASSNSTESSSDAPSEPAATDETLPDDAPEELKKLEAEAIAKNQAAEAAVGEAEKAVEAFDEAVDDHLVNEDEVGVVEGVGVDSDLVEMRDVDVTCFKCGQKSGTSVTRKQFEEQADNGEQPKFRTRCNKCNYHSTYVLTEEGAHTIA